MNEAKRPYQAPKLVEWGAVVDLTQVRNGCDTDAVFSGSVPCEVPVSIPG